jgi:hypothetical protein
VENSVVMNRTMGDLLMHALIACLAVLGPAPQGSLAPWATNHHPTDAPKRHVEEITAGRHAYIVRQGGAMDGENCRSPLGVGMMDGPAIEQTWESNRAVRLENVGETDILNPWLSNGRNDFRSIDAIVAAAVRPGMTDREKAFALWFQEIRHRYHREGDNDELGDPVKVFNVYGHNTCGNDSICLAGLWRRAGLRVTPPASWATACRRPSSTAAGTSSTATWTRCICCGTTRPWPGSRTSCAITT